MKDAVNKRVPALANEPSSMYLERAVKDIPIFFVPSDPLQVATSRNGSIRVRTGRDSIEFSDFVPSVRDFIIQLSQGPLDVAAVERELGHVEPVCSLAQWYYGLDLFCRRGLVQRASIEKGRLLAKCQTLAPTCLESTEIRVGSDGRCLLASRFAFLCREGREIRMSSSITGCWLTIYDSSVALLFAELAQPTSLSELLTRVPNLSPMAIAQVLQLFVETRMADYSENGADADSDCVESLKYWQFHDALFHANSRCGINTIPVGATCRFLGREPSPPLHNPPSGKEMPISIRHCFEHATAHSQRNFSGNPLAYEQLCAFLAQVGGMVTTRTSRFEANQQSAEWKTQVRPYPNGGGMYELELYIWVTRCTRLEAGLYYYNPERASLVRVTSDQAESTDAIDDACHAMGIKDPPQTLVIIGANFRRIMWKYSGSAYALVLKNVGVLLSEMYHAATRLGLKGCAVGSGNSIAFARACRVHWSTFTSVGEFALGR
jgi:SagB-type dehydrogenase family enzyme